MKRISSNRGVEVHETTTGERAIFIRYESGGKPYLEPCGPEPTDAKAQQRAHVKARKLLEQRRELIRRAKLVGETWVPPHAQRKVERKEVAAAVVEREPLLFDEASKRFLEQCSAEYSRPHEAMAALGGPLAAAFQGRHLDRITRTEIRQYYLDRLERRGPFAQSTRTVSQRTPEKEIAFLSALYTFVADEGHAIENPCHRPRTRRKDSPLAPYRPAHKAPLPSPAALRAMLDCSPRAKAGDGWGAPGRELVTPAVRALVALVYYTAARPESEPCRLTHGDVVLGTGESWGSVTYRQTKTGADRRVLLHPEAERFLKAIMDPVPMDREDRERWAALPIFRRRGSSSKAWEKDSYANGWANMLEAVRADYPETAGLWLRDLRKVAKTRMVDAGVPTETTKTILGHRGTVADGYYVLSDDAQREALSALTLRATEAKPCIKPAATQVGA